MSGLGTVTGRLQRGLLRGVLTLLGPRQAVWPPQVRRILVSGSMGIGNAVMLEPLLQALRERFPGAHLAVTVTRDAASRALFQGWPHLVHEVIEIRGSSRAARFAEGLRLAGGKWDLCVVRFNGAAYEIITACVFGRIPLRAGHVSGGRFHSELDWLFNVPVSMGDFDHEVDRYLALAERLGHTPTRRAPALPVTPRAREQARELLSQLEIPDDQPLVALQPGSSPLQSWKRWPVEHWRSLVAGLSESGVSVVALGSADERELLEDLCRGTAARSAAGATPLAATAAVLERCELLVGIDSALMHVAAAVGTPVVALLGPTDRTRTPPYGEGHTILVPPHCPGEMRPCLSLNGLLAPECTATACMQAIRPETVLAAVLERCRRVTS